MNLDARSLAAALLSADDDALSRLFRTREVTPGATWRDLFDAAESLLEPASVLRGLATLTRADAQRLHDGTVSPSLIDGALTSTDGSAFAAVRAAMADLPAVPSETAEPDVIEARPRAAERAFVTIGIVADLLVSVLRAPLQRIGTGAVGAADRRRLADDGVLHDADDVDLYVGIGSAAGLLRAVERRWYAEQTAVTWLQSTTAVRWAVLATAFRSSLPAGLRTDAGGWLPLADWESAYPWDASWPNRAREHRARAVALGLIDEGPSDASDTAVVATWAATLAAGDDADPSSLLTLLPHEVDRVFLQNDLTAIAPGPLAPELDLRLRTMAVRESHAQASTYRFTASTLASAITEGESADTMRAFLGGLSLTGVPQPLDYLIGDVATRHGLVRVAEGDDGRARISGDPAFLDRIAVDQGLRHLGITRTVSRLVGRAGRDVTCWALADAHYPAVAVDADDRVVTLHRHDVAPPAAPYENPYVDLIAKLRASSGGADADAAWLERELDTAVRSKAVIDVTVRMPDGTERLLTLEAAGLGGGRLRGRDRAADVERTLPVSMIVRVAAH